MQLRVKQAEGAKNGYKLKAIPTSNEANEVIFFDLYPTLSNLSLLMKLRMCCNFADLKICLRLCLYYVMISKTKLKV